MYLADLEEFISRSEGEMVQQRLKEIFGATDEDYAKLRITGLGSEKMDISARGGPRRVPSHVASVFFFTHHTFARVYSHRHRRLFIFVSAVFYRLASRPFHTTTFVAC